MNTCPEYAALLDAYFDGECTPAEADTVRSHLERCEACRTYLEELALLRDAFPDADDTAVPANFAAGVMDAVRAHPHKRPTPWKKTLLPMAACFALLVVAVRLPALQSAKSSAGMAAPAAAPAMAYSAAPAAGADGDEAAEEKPAESILDSTMVVNSGAPAPEEEAPGAVMTMAPVGEAWYAEVTLPARRIAEIPADWTPLESDGGESRYQLTRAQLEELLEELGDVRADILNGDASLALVIIQQTP